MRGSGRSGAPTGHGTGQGGASPLAIGCAIIACAVLMGAVDARPADQSAGAAPPAARVSVDPPRGRVGDRIRLAVSIGEAGSWMAKSPEGIKPGEKLGSFHVLDVDASQPGELILGLTPDETGDLPTPGFEVVFRAPGGEERKVTVPPASVSITSILGEQDATLADIRPPAELPIPWPWKEIVLTALGALLVGAAVLGLRRRLRRPARPPARPEESLPPGVTADAWAREQLAKLLARNLLEAGRHREFHIELADLVRRYLELRFRIPALERTTEEVGEEMRRALLGGEGPALVTEMLDRCDRVKFAKYVPPRGEVDETVALARDLIERTAPVTAVRSAEPLPDAEGTAA